MKILMMIMMKNKTQSA